MAHFAKLDKNNIVEMVIHVNDADCLDDQGNESESVGILLCSSIIEGVWIQTSYSSSIRKNYAGVGFTYDVSRDAFIPPKPFGSWLLIEETCRWIPPSPRPEDGKAYNWIEESLSWVEIAQVNT